MSYQFRITTGFIFFLLWFTACNQSNESRIQPKVTKTEIDSILTQWHKAAAEADFETYFSIMADSSVFIGTDATENWTKQEFMDYSKPYFDKGKAWTFYAKTRNVYSNSTANAVWFDEELVTQNLGPCRGSGVLVVENGAWKLAHYTLSLAVPNDLVGGIVKQIVEFESKQETKN